MSTGIYGIFSNKGECLYIGQSSNIEGRWKQHLKELRSGNHKRKDLVSWYNVFGESSLEFKIVSMCEDKQYLKNELEIIMFKYYKPKFFGQTPSNKYNFSQSEETRKKISDSLKRNSFDKRFSVLCVCGVSITYTISREKKYCSRKCASLGRVRKSDVIDIQDLKVRYDSGSTLHELGIYYGFSYRTIHKLMIKNNIPRR